ncbi:hypothetical protein SDC9_65329 [bioreactor metagenome]|uniref:NodB homology domain-containing protein n=1 Tax=bioreactor metagenome TaxID=1076179 RepID=A0A644XT34_9ZZZZ
MKNDVPCLMYHSVGVVNPKWHWNYLTCPYEVFENQLSILKKLSYTTVSLNELYNYMMYGIKLPKRSIVITFDDGYLDNWVFAYPILKKYGFCATVFVNPDFVEKSDCVRKRLDQVNYITELQIDGYLSWNEIKIMEEDAVIFAESHALTHTWYPINNKIIDYRHPGDNYIWMTWNDYRDNKPFLQIDKPELIKYGQPIYEYEKSLLSKRYFPNSSLDNLLTEYVNNNGGINFFKNSDWKLILDNISKSFTSDNSNTGEYESFDDYKCRIAYELEYTKKEIERRINKTVSFLCWPGGSGSKLGLGIAEELGYKFFNSAKDLTVRERRKLRNSYNVKSNRVSRFAPVFYFNGKENFNSKIIYSSGIYFFLHILSDKYRGIFKLLFRLIQMSYKKWYEKSL